MRRVTAGILVACLVLTAGCAGASIGTDEVVFDAGETVVDEAAVDAAGYELLESNTEEFEETVSPAGRDVRVVVRSHVAVYGKADDAGEAAPASVGVVTMPDASVAGRSLNPLVGMNETQLLEEFLADGERSVDFEVRDRYAVETLGGEANVTVYATESENGGEAFVHLLRASPPGTDDAVIAYATYPAAADETERDGVRELLSSLEHTPSGDATGGS